MKNDTEKKIQLDIRFDLRQRKIINISQLFLLASYTCAACTYSRESGEKSVPFAPATGKGTRNPPQPIYMLVRLVACVKRERHEVY